MQRTCVTLFRGLASESVRTRAYGPVVDDVAVGAHAARRWHCEAGTAAPTVEASLAQPALVVCAAQARNCRSASPHRLEGPSPVSLTVMSWFRHFLLKCYCYNNSIVNYRFLFRSEISFRWKYPDPRIGRNILQLERVIVGNRSLRCFIID